VPADSMPSSDRQAETPAATLIMSQGRAGGMPAVPGIDSSKNEITVACRVSGETRDYKRAPIIPATHAQGYSGD
jgi:hypothetical protein